MKILIGICSIRNDERFDKSLFRFIQEISEHYNIEIIKVKDKFLPDAQNEIVEQFLDKDFDYLLFLDDDQWGHTKEMVDCLIGANTFVSTIKTYSRHYPYSCALLKKIPNNLVMPIENGEGYQEVDLTGFPMTLIRRDLFKFIDPPYFRAVEACGRDWNTDIEFFERLEKLGIKPIGCFQHCLNHDKITQENVYSYREKERFENNNMGWYRILKEQLNQGA